MTDAPLPIGCVIMASGMAKRFGSNKLLADLGGKPVLQWILDTTDGMFCRRIVVTRNSETAAFCQSLGLQVILHALPNRCDTIRLGLEAVGTGAAAVLFCQGDQPFVHRDSLIAMARAAMTDSGKILRLGYGDQLASPVIFPSALFEELSSLPPGAGGGYVMKQHPELVQKIEAQEAHELWDIDTPEDLKKMQLFLSRSAQQP